MIPVAERLRAIAGLQPPGRRKVEGIVTLIRNAARESQKKRGGWLKGNERGPFSDEHRANLSAAARARKKAQPKGR